MTGPSQLRGAYPWIVAFAAVFLTAFIGSAFPPDAWYAALAKPTWQPPNWLFAPVWGALYFMMACSLALLLKSATDQARRRALGWFALQLILNAAWTPLFFGLHAPGLALACIALLWLSLIACIHASISVRPSAGWLLLPTFAWVSFALVLNGVIVALNR